MRRAIREHGRGSSARLPRGEDTRESNHAQGISGFLDMERDSGVWKLGPGVNTSMRRRFCVYGERALNCSQHRPEYRNILMRSERS